MKYVRTAEHIFLINSNRAISKDKNGISLVKLVRGEGYCKVPCVVADKAEELCDCFVVVFEEELGELGLPRVEMFCTLEVAKEIAKAFDEKTKVYGAIWTRKGLIYEIIFDIDKESEEE